MIRAFFSNWGGAFRDAWRVAFALPLLVTILVGTEFAQHVIEVQSGFFSPDPAVHKAAALDPLRMAFGWPKMFLVYFLAFFTTRQILTPHTFLKPSSRAVQRYSWVAGFQLIVAAVIIYAAPILALAGIGEHGVMPLRLVMGLGQQLVEPLLFLWFVNAAMGTRGMGPVTSARVTGWLYLWALPLMFLSRLPFNAAHQLLNKHAAGQPPEILWPMLALDAVVVGVMVVVLAAVQVRIARYIADRRNIPLLDDTAHSPAVAGEWNRHAA